MTYNTVHKYTIKNNKNVLIVLQILFVIILLYELHNFLKKRKEIFSYQDIYSKGILIDFMQGFLFLKITFSQLNQGNIPII